MALGLQDAGVPARARAPRLVVTGTPVPWGHSPPIYPCPPAVMRPLSEACAEVPLHHQTPNV